MKFGSYEIVTDDMRGMAREAHDEIIKLVTDRDQLRSELDQAHSEILRLRLALSCILPIAEEHAAGFNIRTCELIRSSLGEPPKKRKPEFKIVTERTS